MTQTEQIHDRPRDTSGTRRLRSPRCARDQKNDAGDRQKDHRGRESFLVNRALAAESLFEQDLLRLELLEPLFAESGVQRHFDVVDDGAAGRSEDTIARPA